MKVFHDELKAYVWYAGPNWSWSIEVDGGVVAGGENVPDGATARRQCNNMVCTLFEKKKPIKKEEA